MTRRRHARLGYTLLEMLVVLAVLLIIGAIIIPTVSGLTGNTKVKGAADAVKARLLEARLNAMEQGRPYVFAISSDGTKLHVGPDETVEGEVSADGQPIPGDPPATTWLFEPSSNPQLLVTAIDKRTGRIVFAQDVLPAGTIFIAGYHL